MIGAKWFDMVVGVDIHWVLIPAPPSPAPIPTPLPHPFAGLIFDPAGLVVGSAIAGALGVFKGITLTNKMPSASTGTDATNLLLLPHFPMPPGVAWAPVPAGIKPPIPGKSPDPGMPSPIPSNDATIITGSKTVYISGTNACRLGDMAMSCGEPVRLPSSTVIAIPMGPPVLIGGPPALDFMAAAFSFVRSSWVASRAKSAIKSIAKGADDIGRRVSQRMHKAFRAASNSRRSKIICFFTGHPVDVATGKVLTDHIDLVLPGPIPFTLERTYSSDSDYSGSMGYGWGHTYDQHISFEENRIVLHDGEGRQVYFDTVQPGQKTRNHFERMDLRRFSDSITITTQDNLKYHFGQTGRSNGRLYLQKIEDYNESSIRLIYNEDGFLSHIIDSANRRIAFVNDEHGRITSVLVPHPLKHDEHITALRYEYSPDGDLAVVYDAHNKPFTYTYKNHLLVQETNRNGLSFYFAYDGIDNDASCVRTWGDNGIYDHVLIYDKQNRITVVENSLGNKTTYMMDQDNAVVKIISADGGETSYEYDEYSRKIAEKDPLGNETRHEYDNLGNIVKTTNPDGTTLEVCFNEYNLPIEATDKTGGFWKWEYDERLRLLKRSDPMQRNTHFLYNDKHLSHYIDSTGQKTKLIIDDQGNLRTMITPDGKESHWYYDNLGNCIESFDSGGNRQRVSYDMLGRITLISEPDGNFRTLYYDPEGNVIQAHDKHYDVTFEYGGMNRMTARVQNNTRVEFVYDTEEQLTAIKNEHGSVYRFELDAVGNVVTESGFDGIRRIYGRDLAGRVTHVQRPQGLYSLYEYDSLDRITKITHTDESKEFFSYREDGMLLEARNKVITVKFERDPLGRVIKEWQGDHWVQSTYDSLGRRTHMRSSMGAEQAITRNSMGDVESLVFDNGADQNGEPYEVTFMRDEFGLELQRNLPGGVQARWKRDKLGRPIEHSICAVKGYIRTRTYSWDVNDRLMLIQDTQTGTATFSHDAFGNMSAARYENGAEMFRMPDAIGNLFRTKERTDRKYGPAGQLLETYGPHGTTSYEYDPEGNLIKKREPDDKIWVYEWNASGMLTRVIRPDGNEVTFTYDPLGRRISKTYRGITTRWVWDGNVPLHEWIEHAPHGTTDHDDQSEDIVSRIKLHLVGRPANGPPDISDDDAHNISLRDSSIGNDYETHDKLDPKRGTVEAPVTWLFEPESFAPVAKLVGDKRYSILTDHLGTPFAMFDRQGENSWSMELDIYGRVKSVEGNREDCPFRYPGQYEDSETGLYYNRFRYYDPEAGGYVSQDPIGLEGGINTYAYVHDQNSWIDVYGLSKLIANQPLPDGITLFRIGGNSISNLKLKNLEMTLNPPGISLLRANSAKEAGDIMKKAFPTSTRLHSVIDAGNIAEITSDQIRNAGFDVIHNPTKNLGDAHARLIHIQGVDGFSETNLKKLSGYFTCAG